MGLSGPGGRLASGSALKILTAQARRPDGPRRRSSHRLRRSRPCSSHTSHQPHELETLIIWLLAHRVWRPAPPQLSWTSLLPICHSVRCPSLARSCWSSLVTACFSHAPGSPAAVSPRRVLKTWGPGPVRHPEYSVSHRDGVTNMRRLAGRVGAARPSTAGAACHPSCTAATLRVSDHWPQRCHHGWHARAGFQVVTLKPRLEKTPIEDRILTFLQPFTASLWCVHLLLGVRCVETTWILSLRLVRP